MDEAGQVFGRFWQSLPYLICDLLSAISVRFDQQFLPQIFVQRNIGSYEFTVWQRTILYCEIWSTCMPSADIANDSSARFSWTHRRIKPSRRLFRNLWQI